MNECVQSQRQAKSQDEQKSVINVQLVQQINTQSIIHSHTHTHRTKQWSYQPSWEARVQSCLWSEGHCGVSCLSTQKPLFPLAPARCYPWRSWGRCADDWWGSADPQVVLSENIHTQMKTVSLNTKTLLKVICWQPTMLNVSNVAQYWVRPLHSGLYCSSPVFDYVPFLPLRPVGVFCSLEEVPLLLFGPFSALHPSPPEAVPLR